MENTLAKFERLAVVISTENAVNVHQEQEYSEDEDEDGEEEETPSFCDLPLDHLSRKPREEDDEERVPLRATESQEDFHFCYLPKDSEMCDANEVFFQGQILPFRHSLSSDQKGLFQCRRSISKSESIDGSSSITLFSSRSSSISSSHRSYSSRSSAATATTPWRRLPNPMQNHSHSHRSSPPRINFPTPGIIRTNNGMICSKKTSSSVWNILRLGILVTSPPEIMFLQDLRTRSCPVPNTNRKNIRSRNCSSVKNKVIISDSLKRKSRGLLGGCNCSNDAVDTVRSRVVSIEKSACEMEKHASVVQPMESPKQQAAKNQGTQYRTFEWLKQLSLEDTGGGNMINPIIFFTHASLLLWPFNLI